MEPKDLVHNICWGYIKDHPEVDDELTSRVSGFLRARDVAKLSTCSLCFDWQKHTVSDWRFLRQIEAFYKKNALFAEKEKCSAAAKEAFFANEASCMDTNLRLSEHMWKVSDLDHRTSQMVHKAQRYIYTVLGEFQSFINLLPGLVKVTPGATSTSSRKLSLPQLKLRLSLFCTDRARPYLFALYRFFGFKRCRFRPTFSNRVELVPKNWKTDRTIACEPEGNLPLQLAFDTWAKRRLRRFGIDLADQSANQRKAKHASIHNDYVTVDFSSASDTISYNTVWWLFPPDWFGFLDDVRSPCYRGVFGEGKYAKFSSMGNGSTFAIETLLFAAACKAVGSSNFLVYGDDVIIERKFYEDFIRFTRFLGFSVNESKSFHDGPFRESCGSDYWNGIDVTPVYIRTVDTRKSTMCHLVNTLASLTFPGSKVLAILQTLVSEGSLPFVPFNESTLSGVWIDPHRARVLGILKNKQITRDGPRLDYFKAYTPKSKRRKFVDIRGYYLWFLYRNSQVLFGGPWDMTSHASAHSETSSAPIFQHDYVRKWVSWREPTEATPVHVTWIERLG